MTASIPGHYHGKGSPLFALYLKTAVLTILTLGIYRFWGKTRIRKYIWSATSGNNDSFEYTGTGLEKFLGFLIAIVVLAIYLGIVQMILFYFGLAVFGEPQSDIEALAQLAGIYITVFAAVPLFLFAQYRARRYRMARTRWRGLRFGMETGAWGYVLRAIGHYLLTFLTLGLLLPRQTFYLEKYMTDRTWYGDAKFVQVGKWTALYRGMKHIFIGVGLMIVGLAITAFTQSPAPILIFGIVGYFWALIGLVSYRIFSLNYLTRHKVLDKEVSFTSDASTAEVVGIYIVGSLAIAVLGAILGYIATTVVAGALAGLGTVAFEDLSNINFVVFLVPVLSYIIFFLLFGGLFLVLITQKVIAHVVSNVTVLNADHLDTIRQRAADKGADAEGFADALDVGAAV